MHKSLSGSSGDDGLADASSNAADKLNELAEAIASLQAQIQSLVNGNNGGSNSSQIQNLQGQLGAITTPGLQTTVASSGAGAATAYAVPSGGAAPAGAISNDPFAAIRTAGTVVGNPAGMVTPTGSPMIGNTSVFGPGGDAGGYGYLLGNVQRFGSMAAISAVAGATSHYATEVLNVAAQQVVTGQVHPMQMGQMFGSAGGAILGGGIGFLFGGPAAAAGGAAIGSGFGGAIGNFATAGVENKFNSIEAQLITKGTLGTFDRRTIGSRDARFDMTRDMLADEHGGEWVNGPYGVSSSTIAGAYVGIENAMLTGGLDPYAKTGSRTFGITDRDGKRWDDVLNGGDGTLTGKRSRFQLMDTLTANAIAAIHMMAGGREEAGESVTRRAFERYKDKAPDVLKDVGQIYADMPDVGDNLVDRIAKYGPMRTMEFDRLQNDQGTLPMAEGNYFRLSADVRTAGRNVRRAGLQTRGSAAAQSGILASELDEIGAAPGGKDSMLYAQTAAQLRDARRQQFGTEGITSFELPMSHLNGMLDRASVMPFAPANVLAMTMQAVGLERQEVGRIDAYTKQRRSRGELSEEEELQLSQRRESLLTTQAQQITQLSDGFIQRLPSFASGLPGRFQGRFTTESMAAFNVSIMGAHHIRAFGARNGQEIAAQDAIFDSIGAPKPPRATSPTQNTSNAMNSDKILAVLMQIAQLLASGQRGGGRAGEGVGTAAASLSRTSLGNATQGYHN